MTRNEKEWVRHCVETDAHLFYNSQRWLNKRAEVLALDKFECQTCRKKYHRFRPATTVHHVNHLKARPDLALETWYRDPATHEEKRNLISLCHDCHEEAHGYRKKEQSAPLTEERWD